MRQRRKQEGLVLLSNTVMYHSGFLYSFYSHSGPEVIQTLVLPHSQFPQVISCEVMAIGIHLEYCEA